MSKVAVITDTHFGARGDTLPMQHNQSKFLKNVFFPTLDQYGIKTVIHGGDYTDRRKFINYQTAGFIQGEYRDPLNDRGITEIVLTGNHDCFYKQSNSINSIDQLYRLDPQVRVLSGPATVDVEGLHILFLPWICEENATLSMKLLQTSKARVVIGHLEIKNFAMYRGMAAIEGLDPDLFGRFELVLSGHFHHKSQQGNIHYLGAPWPMVWSDYADQRGFHILDTDTLDLTFVENPYTIFARLVYDDAGKAPAYIADLIKTIQAPDSPYRDAYVKVVVKSKSQPYWFDMLTDELYKVNPLDILVVDDIVVGDADEARDVITADMDTAGLIRDYVKSLEINCDKAALTTYLDQLYVEAMGQSGRL